MTGRTLLEGAALAALAAILAPQAVAATVEAATKPVAVTVYDSRASVTRAGTVELPAGDSVLVFRDLPPGLVRDSLSVRGSGQAKVAIGSVDVRRQSDPAAANKRRAEIEAQMRGVQDQIAVVDARAAGYAAQRTFMQRLVGSSPEPVEGGAGGLGDPANWKSAWTAVRDGMTEAADGEREAAKERRALEEKLSALSAELSGAGRRGGDEVAVSVHAQSPTKFDVSLSYQVGGASWQPVYQARLDTAGGRLLLRQEGAVTQATGEDWQGVALTLSTSRPSAGAHPPALAPWRLDLWEDQPAVAMQERAARAAPMMKSVAAAAAPAADAAMEVAPGAPAAAPPPVEAVTTAAVAQVAGLSVEYAIPGATTVRSDGTQKHVRVADTDVESRLSVRIVPRLDTKGYLTAHFTNPTEEPLLAGRANLYLDGVFVGAAALPMVRQGEQAALPFGADARIKAAYDAKPTRKGTEGVAWGKRATFASEAVITVRSYHDKPVEVVVLDQAPVPGNDEIKVEVAADPKPTASDYEKPGVAAWIDTYRPGEERRIRFGYTVNSPDGKRVVGLPAASGR